MSVGEASVTAPGRRPNDASVGESSIVGAGRRPIDARVGDTTLPPEPRDRLWVFYDDDCAFCRACVGWALRRDRRGRLIAVAAQSAEAQARLGAQAANALVVLHVWSAEGGVRSGSDAVAAILERLPGWGAAGGLMGSAPVRPIAGVAYRWVAARRNWWGRPGSGGPPGGLGGRSSGGAGA